MMKKIRQTIFQWLGSGCELATRQDLREMEARIIAKLPQDISAEDQARLNDLSKRSEKLATKLEKLDAKTP